MTGPRRRDTFDPRDTERHQARFAEPVGTPSGRSSHTPSIHRPERQRRNVLHEQPVPRDRGLGPGLAGGNFVAGEHVEAGPVVSDDDELAYAYHAANRAGEPYDRRSAAAAYGRTAFSYYTPEVIEGAIDMIFRAIGINRARRASHLIGRLAWRLLRVRLAAYALATRSSGGVPQPAE